MFNLHNWHSFQIISVLGIITALIVQIILFLIGKDIMRMWALYPSWVFLFTVGYFLNRKEAHAHAHEDELHNLPNKTDRKL